MHQALIFQIDVEIEEICLFTVPLEEKLNCYKNYYNKIKNNSEKLSTSIQILKNNLNQNNLKIKNSLYECIENMKNNLIIKLRKIDEISLECHEKCEKNL